MYADYNFYKDVYKGTKIGSEDKFNRLSFLASNIIDTYTFNKSKNIVIGTDEYVIIQSCSCVLSEYLLDNPIENSNIASENIGSYSISYRTDVDSNKIIEDILAMWLPRELLYKGLGKACLR